MSNNFNQLLRQKLIENFHKKMLSEQVPGPYIPPMNPNTIPPNPLGPDYDPMNPSGPNTFPPVTIDPDTGKPTRWFWPGIDREWWLPTQVVTNPFRPPTKPAIPRPGFNPFDPSWTPNPYIYPPNIAPRPFRPPPGWQPGQYGY